MRGFKLPVTTIADIKALRAKGVDGVEGFVREATAPRRPTPAPEPRDRQEMPIHPLARLLERELAGEFDFTRLPDVGPQYSPGEVVKLTAGAFADLQAQVVSMLAKGRVEVLIPFMGRASKAQVKATELQRLEAAE